MLDTPAFDGGFRMQVLGRAKQTLIQRLAHDPTDVERVDLLARIAAANNDPALRQAALGVLVALGHGSHDVLEELLRIDARVPARPQITLDENALAEIADPDDGGPLTELFAAMAETITLALGPSLASRGVTKKDRVESRGGNPHPQRRRGLDGLRRPHRRLRSLRRRARAARRLRHRRRAARARARQRGGRALRRRGTHRGGARGLRAPPRHHLPPPPRARRRGRRLHRRRRLQRGRLQRPRAALRDVRRALAQHQEGDQPQDAQADHRDLPSASCRAARTGAPGRSPPSGASIAWRRSPPATRRSC